MNVYDFDFTIYDGDCTVDFIQFCIWRAPRLLRYLPGQALAMARYKLTKRFVSEHRYDVYRFLTALKDPGREVELFWRRNMNKIQPFYLAQQRADDVVISASPVFLLAPVCGRLGITGLIASKVDIRTGESTSVNCYGEEKVRLFLQQYPNSVVEAFYSDSLSDAPMARLAQRSYLVRGGKPRPWPKNAL